MRTKHGLGLFGGRPAYRAGRRGWLLGAALLPVFAALLAAVAGEASPAKPIGDATRCDVERPKGGLVVLAGAGLRAPMEACRKEFERRHKAPVRIVYGGSQCLLAQIAITYRNALIDVYAPGEEFYAKQARDRGFVTTYKPMAYFVPVIMVREGNPKGIRTLQDLAKPGLRVGIGEQKACAIGKTTQDLLKKHGLTEKVKRNVVMHTAMAPELGNAVKLGSIDATINWDAVAAGYEDGADIVPIPAAQNIAVRSSMGILKNAKDMRLARQFMDFVTGPEGRAIFKKSSYTIDLKAPVYPEKAKR